MSTRCPTVYKCASVGCYSCESPETNTLLQKLQTAINQFAKGLSFVPVKIDGIIGKGTTQAAIIVLDFLSGVDKGVVGAEATKLSDQIGTPEQLTLAAQRVVDVIALATKQSAIASQTTPVAALPPAQAEPSTVQLVTTSANAPLQPLSPTTQQHIDAVKAKKPGLSTSLLDRVPPWAAYASGAALAVGILTAVVIGSKRKKKALGPAPAAKAAVAGRYW